MTLADGEFSCTERQIVEEYTGRLYRQMLDRMSGTVLTDMAGEHNTCFLWALALHVVLCLHRHRSMMRVGSVGYMMVREEDDDGVSPTHFSYMFNKPNAVAYMLGAAEFLEHHAWVEVQDRMTGEHVLIDPSARFSYPQGVQMLGSQVADKWKETDRFNGWVWIRSAVLSTFEPVQYVAGPAGGLEDSVLHMMLMGLLPVMHSQELAPVRWVILATCSYLEAVVKKNKGPLVIL